MSLSWVVSTPAVVIKIVLYLGWITYKVHERNSEIVTSVYMAIFLIPKKEPETDQERLCFRLDTSFLEHYKLSSVGKSELACNM